MPSEFCAMRKEELGRRKKSMRSERDSRRSEPTEVAHHAFADKNFPKADAWSTVASGKAVRLGYPHVRSHVRGKASEEIDEGIPRSRADASQIYHDPAPGLDSLEARIGR